MDPDSALERVNYFQGQLLSSSDLRAEQEYFSTRSRLHNRYLHGWGVVSGLEVTTAGSSDVVVEPGVAIDCAGNEIHMSAAVTLKIPETADAHFVVLQYAESLTSLVPATLGPTLADSLEPTFARIREGFLIDIVDVPPAAGHQEVGTPGCGLLHPVCIARIKPGRHGWKVKPRGRRPA